MTVTLSINRKEYVLDLIDAKIVLNSTYAEANTIKINNEIIEVDMDARNEIQKQLHGQIYV